MVRDGADSSHRSLTASLALGLLGCMRLLTMRGQASAAQADLILRSPPSAGVSKDEPHQDSARLRILAAPIVRVVQRSRPSKKQRAQGMPGASRARGLVCEGKSTQASHHRFSTVSPAFPAQRF